jgi:D-alanyl-D-alanine carboxypeptidase
MRITRPLPATGLAFNFSQTSIHEKIIAALATSVMLMTSAVAQTLPAPTIAAKSWLLLDATSGQIIASQDPNARIEPASLTKIMTAYVTFGALREKNRAEPDGQRLDQGMESGFEQLEDVHRPGHPGQHQRPAVRPDGAVG